MSLGILDEIFLQSSLWDSLLKSWASSHGFLGNYMSVPLLQTTSNSHCWSIKYAYAELRAFSWWASVHQIFEDDGLAEPWGEDEEGERDMWLLLIRLNILKCVDLMASLRKVMLSMSRHCALFCMLASAPCPHLWERPLASLSVPYGLSHLGYLLIMFIAWQLASTKEHASVWSKYCDAYPL